MVKKTNKEVELEQKVAELTTDLQRVRADFENYRKRVEVEKVAVREASQAGVILKLLPVIDNIERAVNYTPEDLKENKWVQGVIGLSKNLEKSFDSLGLKKIESSIGSEFNPDFHDAIQFDEEATGETEIIAEEMQSGYLLNGNPIRHAMVKVTRK